MKSVKLQYSSTSIGRPSGKNDSNSTKGFRKSSLFPTEYSIELRQRVEWLETERADAWSREDHEAVDQLDRQIHQVIVAWTDSFLGDFEWRYRKMTIFGDQSRASLEPTK